MIRKGNKILLGKRKNAHGKGTYGWCGGHLEYGEKLHDCAKREVFEETGLEVTSLELICISNIIEYGKHYVDIEFKAQVRPGEPEVKEPEKVEGWEWFDLDKLPKPLFKAVERAIASYKSKRIYNP